MLRSFVVLAFAAAVVAPATTVVLAQNAGVALSPFVALPQAGGSGPMAGLSIGVNGGPLALRAGGHMSMRERNGVSSTATALVTRPWGVDADMIAYLESYEYGQHLTFTPYVLTGLSTTATDSGLVQTRKQGWSYGLGTTLPFGGAFGAFAEARWRMNQYVMPTSAGAPPAMREMRFGIAFRVGGGGEAVSGLSSLAEALLATADSYVGTPYRRGGTTPSGFDAWGFVRFVFGRLGIPLPAASREQNQVGSRVRPDWRAIEPGDLVVFDDGSGTGHVAIYVGKRRIIHASEADGAVRYDVLDSDRGRWFADHLANVRRVAPAETQARKRR